MHPNLRPVETFALQPPKDADDDPYRVARSALLRDGAHTGLALEGRCLEGQFQVDGGHWLLVLSDGSPYEETLRIHLLDEALRVMEVCTVGRAYAPGLFRQARVAAADRLRFVFDGDGEMELQVHGEGRHFWNAGASVAEALRLLRRRRLQVRNTGVGNTGPSTR